MPNYSKQLPLVASFTDAWIETVIGLISGLWVGVASFTDAWIETFAHPLSGMSKKSHLLQMRGLKPSPGGIAKKLLVASFTDAWIQTRIRH